MQSAVCFRLRSGTHTKLATKLLRVQDAQQACQVCFATSCCKSCDHRHTPSVQEYVSSHGPSLGLYACMHALW